jgi:cell division protein FtsW
MDDSIYRLRLHDVLTLCVLALMGVGVLMVQSADMRVDGDTGWYWTSRAMKNMSFAGVGLVVYFLVMRIDYRWLARSGRSVWKSPAVWAIVLAMVACAAVLVPGIGFEVNGARRWIKLGPVQLQSSELGKWAVVIFLAWWLTYHQRKLQSFFGFVLTLVPVGLVCLFIVIEDFGTAALIGGATLAILLAGRVKLWHLAVVIPPAMAAAVWFITHKEYRLRRMTSFLNPFEDPRGEGYHMIQSLLSFATGGLTGKGLGNGVQKLGYLPEDTTDFIYAVVCEELGIGGAVLVVALYLGILYVSWCIARQSRDTFGRLLAFGTGAMIGLQAVINIAVATVSVPTKGLSLPLVSAGGTGLIITCGALGLLASVARHRHNADYLPLEHTRHRPGFPVVSVATLERWTKPA